MFSIYTVKNIKSYVSSLQMVPPDAQGHTTQKNRPITEQYILPEEPPFKCPVSTPLNGRRPTQNGQHLQFVSVDCSHLQTAPKQNIHGVLSNVGGKKMPVRKFINKQVRKRNLDYYYVDKTFQNKMSNYTNSSWLKGLCAQPVGEIFYKYRHDQPMKRVHDENRVRSFKTPGELAIMEAWESNSSKRGSSALSRNSRFSKNSQSTIRTRTISPNLTITSKGFSRTTFSEIQTPRNDSRVDSVPHPPSPGGSDDSRSSTPINKDDVIYNNRVINPYSLSNNLNRNINKLPDINHRHVLRAPQRRKYFSHTVTDPYVTKDGSSEQILELSNSKLTASCTLCVMNEAIVP